VVGFCGVCRTLLVLSWFSFLLGFFFVGRETEGGGGGGGGRARLIHLQQASCEILPDSKTRNTVFGIIILLLFFFVTQHY